MRKTSTPTALRRQTANIVHVVTPYFRGLNGVWIIIESVRSTGPRKHVSREFFWSNGNDPRIDSTRYFQGRRVNPATTMRSVCRHGFGIVFFLFQRFFNVFIFFYYYYFPDKNSVYEPRPNEKTRKLLSHCPYTTRWLTPSRLNVLIVNGRREKIGTVVNKYAINTSTAAI